MKQFYQTNPGNTAWRALKCREQFSHAEIFAVFRIRDILARNQILESVPSIRRFQVAKKSIFSYYLCFNGEI